jgi:serine/threonine-protein kinase
MRTPAHRRFARQGILAPGTKLGSDLTIRSLLGEGGTGLVYCAYHAVLKREVAVKMCHAGPTSRELAERLVQEARLCASVRDARVPRIYALDKLEDGTPYLVMEKVEGQPLSTLLARGALHARVACDLTSELLGALESVHRAQVIHRDVKPSNLIIDLDAQSGPRVRLLDFGIGKVVKSWRHSSPVLTRPGEVVGTPMYMAPEQMIEAAIDPRVDVYAAGVVLYEMLAGRPPFRAPSVAETFVAVLHDEMPRLDLLRPDLPAKLVNVVHKAAARRADDRFDSVLAMRRALSEASAELPAGAAGQLLAASQPEEHSPTLVWKRCEVAQSSASHLRGRPLPASLARTLRLVRHDGAIPLLPSTTPVGFRARPSPAARAVGGWRVQSVSF